MRIFLAMLAPLLWGTTYVVVSNYFTHWSPFALAVWRALPAGLLLLALKPTFPKMHELLGILIVGFLNITLFFGMLFNSALHMPSALVGVGMMALPVIGVLVVGVIHHQKPSWLQITSALLLVACAGYLFITNNPHISVSAILFLLGAMTTLITGSIVTKHIMKSIHWWKLLTWKLIFGGLMLAPLAWWDIHSHTNYVSPIPSTLMQWGAMFWLVVALTSLAYSVYVYTIPLITTTELSFFGTFNPILAMVLGATLVSDAFSEKQIIIMAVMVMINLATQYYESRKSKASPDAVIEY
ncbi:DMT family transporter [Photobacterium sanguinicancri]|uniref:DMT family transporter n=1 Tax=Photobacterium sanguinicancri TaxID=875932 RepID=UPI0007893D89|nr:EamA family transporter [Photobacterium sanguinicancri]KXI20960.1 hypothetical protein AS132_23815 [Photobacterium sanguinicancri]